MTPRSAASLGVEVDRARQRYERLRDHYLHGSDGHAGLSPDKERFARWGFAGLREPHPPPGYVAQIHPARAHQWGDIAPRDAALREVVRLVLSPKAPSGS